MAKQYHLSQNWSVGSVNTLDAPPSVGLIWR